VDYTKLRCFQIFKPSSTVPDPLIKRNKLKINDRVKVRKTRLGPAPKSQPDFVDPWAEGQVEPTIDGKEWMYAETVRHNSAIKKKYKAHKTSELKAIDIPHPGYSINPRYGDHQELLQAAVDTELKAIKKEEKLKRATRIPDTAVDHDEMMKLEPYVIEEVKTEDESDDDKKPVLTKPKTKKLRRREKMDKESQQSFSDQKKVRVMESDVYRIKQIRREIEKEEAEKKAKLLKKVGKKIHAEKFGQKKLSKWTYEPEKINPLLSDELSGRLVEAKTTSNLLLDRFKSLQKRNILEVRVKQRMKRVNKLKRYERPVDKMEWEKTGVWNGFKL
jgi:nucleolar protein 53